MIALFVVGGGVGLWFAQREHRRRRALLQEVADKRGGRVEPGLPLGEHVVIVELPVGTITAWMRSSKHSTQTVWRLVARDKLPTFRLVRRDFAGRIVTALGGQDYELGYPSVDEDVIVKAEDVGLVKRVWTLARVRHLLDKFDACRTEDDHTVVLERDRGFEFSSEIEEGIDFLLELAKVDVLGRAALRALPEATEHAGYVVIAGPGDIRIGPETGADGITRTVARSSIGLDGEVPAVLAAKVGAGTVVRGADGVYIEWPSIEDDGGVLVGAIQVLRTLAQGPSFGAFR